MRKQRILKLSVPKPCHEDWDNMTAHEKGRFCSQCHKTVIDFSNFTDKELLEYFKKSKNDFCGKFNSLQLDRAIIATESSNTQLFRRVLLGTALAAGVAGTVQGQSKQPVETTIAPVPIPADTTTKPIVDRIPVTSPIALDPTPPIILGGGNANVQYVIDGTIIIDNDTASSSSFSNFVKELLSTYLGIPAPEEGTSMPHR